MRGSAGLSSGVRPPSTANQDIQRGTSHGPVPTSTMPGGLNLGLDAELPEYIPAGDATGSAQVPIDERQCRICLGGADEEDTLGRLISPCLCKGSMKYVHIEWYVETKKSMQRQEHSHQCIDQ